MPHSGQTGVYFPANNGSRLLGTLFMAQGDEPKPTAILLHGLPGIEKNVDVALNLRKNGWNSLLFHYQGCWGSGGDYTFKGLPDDTRSALDYLASGKHEQVDPDKIVLVGHSMGGWTAVLAAVNEPRVKAVAIIGAVCDPGQSYFSDEEIEAEFTPWLHGMTISQFQEQWSALQEDYAPTQQVHKLTQPLLVIHAEQDEVVWVGQARSLMKNVPPGTAYHEHPEANHSFTWHRRGLWVTLWEWLQALEFIKGSESGDDAAR